MYTHIHIHIYIYIYIYTYIYLVRHGNRQDIFYGFRRRHHPTFFNGFRRWLFYGFRRGRKRFLWFPSLVFLWFPSWQENCFSCCSMVPVLAAASEVLFDSSQIRDCAVDTRARSDSDIAMRSPAAKDPDLTSGLRGFNPWRARFQGNCVCLFLLVFVCFCLFLLVFWIPS